MKNATTTNQVELPFLEPTFHIPVIKLRQPDGSLLVRAGRPEICEPEVSIAEFSKATGISVRHIWTLCEEGHINHRRLTPKKGSKIIIPRTELTRFKTLKGDV